MKKTLIQHIEVTESGGRAAIEFTVIPQTYTDLYLVLSMRTVNASGNWWDVLVSINGLDTNQTQRVLYGSGSAAASFTETRINLRTSHSSNTGNTFGSVLFYVPNYTSSASKSISMDVVSENNATAAFAAIQAGLWNSSSAITSLTFTPQTGNLEQYSSASLYGVTAGNDGTTTVS